MTQRKNRVPVMMSDRELEDLDRKAAAMQAGRSEYIRLLIARDSQPYRSQSSPAYTTP